MIQKLKMLKTQKKREQNHEIDKRREKEVMDNDVMVEVRKTKKQMKEKINKANKIAKKTTMARSLSPYEKLQEEKIKRNNEKLISLGLGSKSSKRIVDINSDLRICTGKKDKKEIKSKSTKRQKGQSDCNKKKECENSHTNFTSGYRQECDKRYFEKDQAFNGVCCAKCKIKFESKKRRGICVPTTNIPVYICIGSLDCDCTHSYCNACYFSMIGDNVRSSRRRCNK